MSSIRTAVRRTARLEGMGFEVVCTVMTTEVRLPNANVPPTYGKMSIRDEPKELPDGEYVVSFPGHSNKVRKQNGMWVASVQ